MDLKVEIVSKSTVKPSSPTPQHLKTFKFSIFDQLNPSLYVPLLLYYYPNDQAELDPFEKSEKLKWSLSQVLTYFYPLAGRIEDNFSVQCTDEGAEFIETQIDLNLSDILKLPDAAIFNKLLPTDISSVEAITGRCLLAVQANFFKQGGLVIGICISHKIADGSTLSSFVNAWAGLAVQSPEIEFPVYGASARFPPIDYLDTLPTYEVPKSNCVMRRYVFNAAKIAALKSEAASESVSNPTSVEVISALLWKCATKASRKHNYLMKVKPSVLGQAVNLRKRLDPPLPDSYVGNLAGFFSAKIEENEIMADLALQTLVSRLREGKDGMRHYIEQLLGEHGSVATCGVMADYGGLLMSESLEFYVFTSWCRFSFYEADFSWGKPSWVSIAKFPYNNIVMLIDALGRDGIEAWVTMGEATMAIFEIDEELLQFAVLNPSIP